MFKSKEFHEALQKQREKEGKKQACQEIIQKIFDLVSLSLKFFTYLILMLIGCNFEICATNLEAEYWWPATKHNLDKFRIALITIYPLIVEKFLQLTPLTRYKGWLVIVVCMIKLGYDFYNSLGWITNRTLSNDNAASFMTAVVNQGCETLIMIARLIYMRCCRS